MQYITSILVFLKYFVSFWFYIRNHLGESKYDRNTFKRDGLNIAFCRVCLLHSNGLFHLAWFACSCNAQSSKQRFDKNEAGIVVPGAVGTVGCCSILELDKLLSFGSRGWRIWNGFNPIKVRIWIWPNSIIICFF